MDEKTIAAYDADAPSLAGRFRSIPSPMIDTCVKWFRAGCRVLDVGFGSGRDMEALRMAGFDVVGFDPSSAMVAEAQAAYPALSGRIEHAGLPIPTGMGPFGGILCAAVLMHVPAENWFDAIFSIRKNLEPGGRTVVSVSSG